MKLPMVLALLGACVGLCHAVLPQMNNVHTKFQYKLSFKGPHMMDSSGNLPFWTHGGSKNVLCRL